eukprot:3744612-Rhodomonas_salina.2
MAHSARATRVVRCCHSVQCCWLGMRFTVLIHGVLLPAHPSHPQRRPLHQRRGQSTVFLNVPEVPTGSSRGSRVDSEKERTDRRVGWHQYHTGIKALIRAYDALQVRASGCSSQDGCFDVCCFMPRRVGDERIHPPVHALMSGNEGPREIHRRLHLETLHHFWPTLSLAWTM